MALAVPPLEPNTTFGPYRIVRLLGQGTFGSVYEALRLSVGKRVALKLLDPKLTHHPEAVARFEREAYATAVLDHPNIVTVFDVGEEQGRRYLTMEYLDGETLEARLKRSGVLAPAEIAEIFLPLLSALAKVHEQGFVHRDLKPANVFLSERIAGVVEPKLLDFGMVKPDTAYGHAALTRKGGLLGSPSYMSPEQAEARSVDQRSDLFAVGAVLWECASGRRLFTGSTVLEILQAVVNAPIAAPSGVRPGVPREIDALVLTALQRDPERRFQTARDMARALLSTASPSVCEHWVKEFGAPTTVEVPAAPTGAPAPATVSDDALEGATTRIGEVVNRAMPGINPAVKTVPVDVRALVPAALAPRMDLPTIVTKEATPPVPGELSKGTLVVIVVTLGVALGLLVTLLR